MINNLSKKEDNAAPSLGKHVFNFEEATTSIAIELGTPAHVSVELTTFQDYTDVTSLFIENVPFANEGISNHRSSQVNFPISLKYISLQKYQKVTIYSLYLIYDFIPIILKDIHIFLIN